MAQWTTNVEKSENLVTIESISVGTYYVYPSGEELILKESRNHSKIMIPRSYEAVFHMHSHLVRVIKSITLHCK